MNRLRIVLSCLRAIVKNFQPINPLNLDYNIKTSELTLLWGRCQVANQ